MVHFAVFCRHLMGASEKDGQKYSSWHFQFLGSIDLFVIGLWFWLFSSVEYICSCNRHCLQFDCRSNVCEVKGTLYFEMSVNSKKLYISSSFARNIFSISSFSRNIFNKNPKFMFYVSSFFAFCIFFARGLIYSHLMWSICDINLL